MDQVRLSKLLSLVLRHKPEEIGIIVDNQGWTNVNELLKKVKGLTREELNKVVEENNKQRFSFSKDGTKIRANQGHSLQVDLELDPIIPPDILYHGTAEKYISAIKKVGLQKRNRLYVHLSDNIETAKSVGARHGKPLVISISSLRMYNDELVFYRSENGVWLTDNVDPKYFMKIAWC